MDPSRDEYAGLVSRAGALVVDVVVLTLGSLAVGGLPVLAWEQIISPNAPHWLSAASFAAAAALPWVYFTSFWWLTGQTVGDLLTGVSVQRVRGGELSFLHAAVRAAGCLMLAPLWLVGLLSVLWDRRRMAWHDHVFQTAVRYVGSGSRSGAGHVAA